MLRRPTQRLQISRTGSSYNNLRSVFRTGKRFDSKRELTDHQCERKNTVIVARVVGSFSTPFKFCPSTGQVGTTANRKCCLAKAAFTERSTETQHTLLLWGARSSVFIMISKTAWSVKVHMLLPTDWLSSKSILTLVGPTALASLMMRCLARSICVDIRFRR